MTGCKVPGCVNSVAKAGLCWGHRRRLAKYGDVLADAPLGSLSHHVVCAKCDESRWARDNDITPQEVARSLGIDVRSLQRHFHRQNLTDLAAWARESAAAEDRHYRRTKRERDHATD